MPIQKIRILIPVLLCFNLFSGVTAVAQSILNSDEMKISQRLARDGSGKAQVSLEDAQNILSTFSRDLEIPFRYTKDGCHARAHLMALKLRAMGIVTQKILIQGDLCPKTGEKWSFHIAPLIKIMDEGKIQWRVIDPSLILTPVTELQWIDLNQPRGKFNYRKVSWHRYYPGILNYILKSTETNVLYQDLEYYKRIPLSE